MGLVESCVTRSSSPTPMKKRYSNPDLFNTGPIDTKVSARTAEINNRFGRIYRAHFVMETDIFVGAKFFFCTKTQSKQMDEIEIIEIDSEEHRFKIRFRNRPKSVDRWITVADLKKLSRIPKKQEGRFEMPMDISEFDSVQFGVAIKQNCIICLTNEVSESWLGCSHYVCKDCKLDFLEYAIGDASLFPLKCPGYVNGCDLIVQLDNVVNVLSSENVAKFCKRMAQATDEDQDEDKETEIWVSCPCCHESQLVSKVSTAKFINCCKCFYVFQNPHGDVQNEKAMLEKIGKEEGFQKCPSCLKWIEKSDGCNHMTHLGINGCTQERTDFCYLCGTELDELTNVYEKHNPTVVHFNTLDGVFGLCKNMIENAQSSSH